MGCRRSLSALHAELDGLLWAMSCLSDRNIFSVKFETDCADLIMMVDDPLDWPAFRSEMQHFHDLRDHFDVILVMFNSRSQNVCGITLQKDFCNSGTWEYFLPRKQVQLCACAETTFAHDHYHL